MSKSYKRQRRESYPPLEMLADALVKQASDDPITRSDGESQHAEYVRLCLEVKAMIPKPT